MCLQDSDDAARQPGTGVSGGQAVGESSAAKVVGVGVHDHRASQDVVGSDQRDERILERECRHSHVVSVDVAQVAGVSGVVCGTTVLFSLWVEVRSGGHATVGQVSLFMNVESMCSFGQTG